MTSGPIVVATPVRNRSRHSHAAGPSPLYAMPAFIWYLVFLVGPLVAVFWFSLTDASTLIAPSSFVGVENFERMLGDDVFWTAVRNTVLHVVVVVPIMVALGFMLGYYLYLKPPLAGLLRILFFTSALLSVTTKAMIFYAMLAPDGLVNQALTAVGLDALTTTWLADRSTALPVIMAIDLWAGMGFLAVLFGAQLTSLPGEVFEAARLDGCGHWRSMWRIAYGITQHFVGVIVMLQFLWTLFGSAVTVLLLTDGGPGTSSVTLSFLLWSKAFQQSDIGYSQAVGVLLLAVGLVGTILIRRAFGSRV